MTRDTPICIAAAQLRSHAGDVVANVREHVRFIARAQALGVDVLVFPELSICGYELALLSQLALHPDDVQLAPLRAQVQASNMVAVVGAPLKQPEGNPAIAAISFFPDGSSAVYCKYHLHPSEEHFASAGNVGTAVFVRDGDTVALAICADIGHASHAAAAAEQGASLYLAGVLVSVNGYPKDAAHMQLRAQIHAMGALLANHAGESGDYVSAGKSAFWAPDGQLVAAAPEADEGLLVLSRKRAQWQGQWHAL